MLDAFINALYVWLPRIFGCHCRSDRSFHYKGRQFPLCARCTGQLIGVLSCFILFWFWKPTIIWSIIMMLPLIIDGFVQLLTKYESTNIRRLITGIIFGIGLSAFIVRIDTIIYDIGVEWGKYLKYNFFNF
ncbi:DUF2085 domain-containing protein [bacterium]|nr:DUF2085 domain-containing protein [bacterium]